MMSCIAYANDLFLSFDCCCLNLMTRTSSQSSPWKSLNGRFSGQLSSVGPSSTFHYKTNIPPHLRQPPVQVQKQTYDGLVACWVPLQDLSVALAQLGSAYTLA